MAALPIRVHQTVHGYRAGHQLVQTSRQLPSDVQRTMLVESDLSGPSLLPGFEEYLSGYPLEEIGAYVLARTWYAPEMDRPGCVWTHSLLIEFADLARIEDLNALAPSFRRPALASLREPSLPEVAVDFEAVAPSALNMADARAIVVALYGNPDATVVVLRRSAAELEATILALWSQQWPRLRRSFRFCTGALSVRGHDARPFDLLVAPIALQSALRRDAPSCVFIDGHAPRTEPDWMRSTIVSMEVPNASFRDFLWSYGADVAHPRSAWRGLAEAFQWAHPSTTSTRPTAAVVVASLAEHFPLRDDARRLKMDVLADDSERAFQTKDVLRALAAFKEPEAFDCEALRINERARALWQTDREGASGLLHDLLREELGPIGEQILEVLCDAVGPTVAVELERMQPGLLRLLVSRSPRLARASTLWTVGFDRQRELVEVLAKSGDDSLRSAIAAMVAAGTSEIAGNVERLLGRDVVAQELLRALDANEQALKVGIGRGWLAILTRAPSAVVAWLQGGTASAERLAVGLSVLDPEENVVRSVAAEVWLSAATGAFNDLKGESRLRCAAFLLSLAFCSADAAAGALIAMTYEDVYTAARRSSLPWSLWRWFDHELPPVSRWRGWDWCERLSWGLVERFTRNRWSLQEFVDAARDAGAFRNALAVSERVSGGSEFVDGLEVASQGGSVRLTSAQREALRDHE
jgi:hypothetical protein